MIYSFLVAVFLSFLGSGNTKIAEMVEVLGHDNEVLVQTYNEKNISALVNTFFAPDAVMYYSGSERKIEGQKGVKKVFRKLRKSGYATIRQETHSALSYNNLAFGRGHAIFFNKRSKAIAQGHFLQIWMKINGCFLIKEMLFTLFH